MDQQQVGEWVASIGLDMYQELVEQEVSSGARLVEIATADSNQELIVSWSHQPTSLADGVI